MEFWGIEVKPRESVKCGAEPEKLLHLSQASLGEIKKDKRIENFPVFVKINDQKLVLGTLSPENCPQIQYDLVFEKEFELSHGSKDTSVFFVGYKSSHQDHGSEDDLSDSDSDEGLRVGNKEKAMMKSNDAKPATGKVLAGVQAKAKPQTGKLDQVEKIKSDGLLNKAEDDEDDEEEDDEEEEDDDDESEDDDIKEMPKGTIDIDDEDEDDEDDLKEKIENDKKRSADGALKPSTSKKAKVTVPAGKQKTGDVKKDGKAAIATPTSAKQAGKTPASGDKSKQSSAKSTGPFKCNSCNKAFNSDNALQSHTKDKHSAAK